MGSDGTAPAPFVKSMVVVEAKDYPRTFGDSEALDTPFSSPEVSGLLFFS